MAPHAQTIGCLLPSMHLALNQRELFHTQAKPNRPSGNDPLQLISCSQTIPMETNTETSTAFRLAMFILSQHPAFLQ